MTLLLNVDGLTKSYGQRRAVDGVSFQVHAGQTVGLIGPNGAGKSTTVSMICGLLRADSGEVLIDGQRVGQGNSAVKQKIGLVPQDLAIYEELSARENLKLFGALYGLKGAKLKTRCDEVLALVNLEDRAADKPSTFSGGMKRRLNIAAGLLHDPQLLILDEPTVGVDPQSRNAIFDSLEVLKRQGRTLIYTSHYMEEVEQICTRIAIIDHGRVLASGTTEELKKMIKTGETITIEAVALTKNNLADIRSLSHVFDLSYQDQTMILRCSGAKHNLIRVLNYLQEQDIPFGRVFSELPTLNDVFLEITGKELRD